MQFATAHIAVQKAVIEEFTGAWCGYCPDGARILDDILTTPIQRHRRVGAQRRRDAKRSWKSDHQLHNPAFPQATINRTRANQQRIMGLGGQFGPSGYPGGCCLDRQRRLAIFKHGY
ncbi:MAG: hypothetical protein IPP17_27290 [Bacteroidetes bacterium]|nr:hypothetical protein [Bacteroidota bacterium]